MFPQLSAYTDLGLLALRLAVAAIFLVHAMPKLKKPEGMAAGMGWPKGGVQLLGVAEALGGLSVLSGFYLQLGALLIAVIMLGATYLKIFKWKAPFAAMDKTGWELDLILLGAALALATVGGGAINL